MCNHIPDSVKRDFWQLVNVFRPEHSAAAASVAKTMREIEETEAIRHAMERATAAEERKRDEEALSYIRTRLDIARRRK